MKIFDWHVTDIDKDNGSFTLKFDVTKEQIDQIRYLLNIQISGLQKMLDEIKNE